MHRAHPCSITSDVVAGDGRGLVVIAGPCVLESPETNLLIGTTLADTCRDLGLRLVFKASFDKANRSSLHSARGPGLAAGLDELARLRERLGVPVCTDIHEPAQAPRAAEVVDLLQIPAFLCRQTDLLAACGETGRAVSVKKGQFLAPAEMRHVITKLRESGASGIMLTERGTFFGYHRLVNDFIGLGDLMDFGYPVCFDVTHSTQLPGGGASTTDGRPERAALLARAAVAAGVDAIFLETHPDPPKALSDAATVQPLSEVPALLALLARLHAVVAEASVVGEPEVR
ncbi:MAG: 3-deoxy-8-phosphooctulonate synthase [Phycisphaerales bacterium]|nr:3-deoxy-8-phosphooctulonate synthase [Phycisphaerales bacterium]